MSSRLPNSFESMLVTGPASIPWVMTHLDRKAEGHHDGQWAVSSFREELGKLCWDPG